MSWDGKYDAKKFLKNTTLFVFFRNSSNIERNSESDQLCSSPQSLVPDNVESNVDNVVESTCNSESD